MEIYEDEAAVEENKELAKEEQKHKDEGKDKEKDKDPVHPEVIEIQKVVEVFTAAYNSSKCLVVDPEFQDAFKNELSVKYQKAV